MKTFLFFLLITVAPIVAGTPRELRVGVAGHAFDHLGNLGEQAEAAAASGSTIIYATGFGGDGYSGLPAPAELEGKRKSVSAYVRQAKARGVRLALEGDIRKERMLAVRIDGLAAEKLLAVMALPAERVLLGLGHFGNT